MRQLKRSILADFNARRDSAHDSSLGCSDCAFCAFSEVVTFKVNRSDDSAAHSSAGKRSFNINKAVLIFIEQSLLHILSHGGIDFFDSAFSLAEKGFGINKIERARSITDKIFNAFPVFRLRCILIACHNAPFFRLIRYRKHYVRSVQNTHCHSLLYNFSDMLRAYRNAVIADAEALRFNTALTAVICNSAALVFNAAFKFCPHGNKIICFAQFAL